MAKGFVESHGETKSGPCCEKTCLRGFRPDHDHQPAQLQTLARKLEQVEPQPFPDSQKKKCADQTVPLLLACNKVWFLGVEAKINQDRALDEQKLT